MKASAFKIFPRFLILITTFFVTLSISFAESDVKATPSPLIFGIKYLNFLESNSESQQKEEGFKLQNNLSSYGLFIGARITPNDSIKIAPKFSSYIDKDDSKSGRFRSDHIEFAYKKSHIVDKSKSGFDLEAQLRHEAYTSNEKRTMFGSTGESHIRLTAIRDLTARANLGTEYRFYYDQRSTGATGTERLKHRLYVTPSYFFTDEFSVGPSVYYEYTDKVGHNNREHSLNFRPQAAYNFPKGLELIFDVKYTKIVTNRDSFMQYHSSAFKTPTFELELTWNIL